MATTRFSTSSIIHTPTPIPRYSATISFSLSPSLSPSCRPSSSSRYSPSSRHRHLHNNVAHQMKQQQARKALSFSINASSRMPDALFFDCDGVLVDTERDGHRVSFNQTFEEKGLNVSWDVDLYGELLKIGGGKERMTAYFNKVGWPEAAPKDEKERKDFIASLHKRKTSLFMELIETGLLPLRPGIARLIDEALSSGVKVAVCSTSNEKAVSAIVRVLLGPKRADSITIFAGDVVPRKKPDPAIYLLAAKTYLVDPSRDCRWKERSLHKCWNSFIKRCVVIEDSAIGLAAAKAAGMKCIVTKSGYTAEEDFENADAIFDCVGDPPQVNVNLDFCAQLVGEQVQVSSN